jgi:hypothetical protein
MGDAYITGVMLGRAYNNMLNTDKVVARIRAIVDTIILYKPSNAIYMCCCSRGRGCFDN